MSGYRNGVGPRWWRASGPELQEGCLTFQLPINVAHRMQINYEVIKPEAITLSTKLTVWNGNPQARHQRAANREPWSVTKAKATLQMRSPSGRDRGGFHVHLARMPCTDCVLWMKNFGLRTGIGIGIGFFFGWGGEVRLCCQQTINKIATLARSRLLCWLRLSLQFGSLFHFLLTPTRQTTIHRSTLKKNWSDLGKIKKIGDVPYK